MNDTVYRVETEDGKKHFVAAGSEDEAFQKFKASGKSDQREALKFSAGKCDEVPEGAEVL